MNKRGTTMTDSRKRNRPTPTKRRGVASVLAMMFLVIFGSLAAAMAIVAQGNLRTADSSLKVSRAQSAAESGIVFAQHRLEKETRRFVVAKGVVDSGFAERLWKGTWTGSDGTVTVTAAVGFNGPANPDGLAEAIRDAHLADSSAFAPYAEHQNLPEILSDGTLVTEPVRLEASNDTFWFQLIYELVPGTSNVRVTSVGVDGDIRRSISMQFTLTKKIEYAVISPNRIMIGKNVMIEGPLGTRYGTNAGELTSGNGDPLVMRSDFRYLSSSLDTKIGLLAAAVAQYDVDGDGRLRPGHPTEAQGLSNNALRDLDGDQYVDDFDLFLSEYDTNHDGAVIWDTTRAQASGNTGSAEFSGIDNQLGRLIDLSMPDRNEDGVVDARDTRLGYNDGVLNKYDNYAKVKGRLVFGVTETQWETVAAESWRNIAQGPVRADLDQSPVQFGASTDELRVVTTADFAASASWFSTNVANNFAQQVTAGVSAGGTYTPVASAPYEAVPYGSTSAYDFYQRPIYRNMTFRDVRIPKGTNALFQNCRFEGTVYIETETACNDVNWNYTGALQQVSAGGGNYTYSPRFPGVVSKIGSTTYTDTRTISNSIRFDGCTFLGSIAGDTPGEYAHWRNKIQITGATRFYSDPDDSELALQADGAALRASLLALGTDKLDHLQRSSIMMPGWSVDVGNFSNQQSADPDLTPRVKLKGTIIAGVMDIRGTADVLGTMLMTYRPVAGQGPLFYAGQPESFNTTLGYFGALDGDGEGSLPSGSTFSGYGEIRLRYDPNAKLPDGILWPASVTVDTDTYREGGRS